MVTRDKLIKESNLRNRYSYNLNKKVFCQLIWSVFKNKIAPCKLVLYIDASDESMKKRLLHRGQSSGRVDDNEETIKQRLQTFHQVTTPVIDYYGKQNKLKKVDSERNPDLVFNDVEKILDSFDQGNFLKSG